MLAMIRMIIYNTETGEMHINGVNGVDVKTNESKKNNANEDNTTNNNLN
jgi:hypothetical protein